MSESYLNICCQYYSYLRNVLITIDVIQSNDYAFNVPRGNT